MKLTAAPLTTNTSSNEMLIERPLSNIGVFTIYPVGTWNGAMLTIEASPVVSGDVWLAVEGGEFTESLARNLQISGSRVRGTITSAGGSTSLDLYIE